MDRLKFLQQAIIDCLKKEVEVHKGTTNPLNVNVLADKENNHFQLLMQGWDEDEYTFMSLLHLDIIDGKIWIQWNQTETPIELELLKKGVAAEEIVIGVEHPKSRQFTDFALA